MVEILVPLAFFAIVPGCIWILQKYRAEKHANAMTTLQNLNDKGIEITPDLVQSLGLKSAPFYRPHRDLRRGLFLMAIGIAMIILDTQFSSSVANDEVYCAFNGTALAAFPLLIGLVYIILWVFISRKTDTPYKHDNPL